MTMKVDGFFQVLTFLQQLEGVVASLRSKF